MLTAHFPRVLCSKMSALVPALATADSGGTRLGGVRGGEKKRQGASWALPDSSAPASSCDHLLTVPTLPPTSFCPRKQEQTKPQAAHGAGVAAGSGQGPRTLLPSLPHPKIPSPNSRVFPPHTSFHLLIRFRKTDRVSCFPASLETGIIAIWQYKVIPLP